jgi:hypothetical protein
VNGEQAKWAGRSQTPPDAGLPRAKRIRARSEASWRRPAGHGPAADATDPFRTSWIPTPQGGWVGQRAPEKELGWGLSQTCLLPPLPPGGGEEPLADPRRKRGNATVLLILSVTPNPGLTYVNPPDRFTRGLTGHYQSAVDIDKKSKSWTWWIFKVWEPYGEWR